MSKFKNIYIKVTLSILILFVVLTAFAINGASAPPGNVAPNIGNVAVVEITDTSVNISFTVDQINARTQTRYDTKSTSLSKKSDWNEEINLTRIITLSGLTKGKRYYFSVYAYNASDANKSSHSQTESFYTTDTTVQNGTAPNVTDVIVDKIEASTVNITFRVDQLDARAIAHYGKGILLDEKSRWNNDTSLLRTITLVDLLPETNYSLSVYVHNGSDVNMFSHSPVQEFRTNSTIILNGTAPNISDIVIDGTTDSTTNVTFLLDQPNAKTIINYGTTSSLGKWSDWNNDTTLQRKIMLKNLSESADYYLIIRAYNSTNMNNYTDSPMKNFTTRNSSNSNPLILPKIGNTTPGKNVHTVVGELANFTVSFDQDTNVTWKIEDTVVRDTEKLVRSSYYTNNTSAVGKRNVTVIGKNNNGTVSYSWEWTVEPTTYRTGNRIWDGSKGMSATYTWTAFSFAGFYYDLDTNMGTEEMTIRDISRTIDSRDITYTTSPIEVNFKYENFGKYQVIGFMADKYFAGYKNSTIPGPTNSFDDISTLAQGQLHKVLIDDDTKRTISVGGTIALEDGYVLKATDIDLNARTMLLSLLKDGSEVDSTPLTKDETYVYEKRVGNVEGLPLIMVRFDNVFSGGESQMAFLKGIFQISSSPTDVKVGNRYGRMDVSGVGDNKITMESRESIGLSPATKIDLMGDLKIVVADDSSNLRFALSVERKGAFDVRGTVYPVAKEWTPMNFGLNVGGTNIGFYYDLDEDIGTEKLKVESISGSSIPKGGLVYSTSPQKVSFTYSNFGKYQVVGFMADKYFAGYSGHTIQNPSDSFDDISAIAQGQLHKVLIDDDTKRTVSVGGTIALKDGYVLKATDIDLNARTMLISLLKDGSEVDSTPLTKDETYVYKKKVGSVESLPLIMVRFDNVFSGGELQTAFLKGIFQISETATNIKIGDNFGNMEVRAVSKDSITMENDNSIGLSNGNTVDIMNNVRFKVADSGELRFYPYVSVTPDMIGTQLLLRVPSEATGGDTIIINVTANNIPIEGATVTVEPETGVTSKITNSKGEANFTFPIKSKGKYTITASKLGYEKGNKTIDVQQYIENTLSITAPTMAEQFEEVSIQTVSSGRTIDDVTITYDNNTIGKTNSDGILKYKLESSGIHTIIASKTGYTTVTRDIEVRAPFSDIKSQDISIVPNSTFTGEEVIIRSNVTNAGTKADTVSIDLMVDSATVDNVSMSLNPKETKEISFKHVVSLPEGNYTIKILENEGQLEVKKTSNTPFVAVVATLIGIVIIYLVTTRKGKDAIGKLMKK